MAIDFTLAPEHEAIRTKVRTFIEDTVKPQIKDFDDEGRVANRREYLVTILELREEAKRQGLWLPHMPKEWGGMGLVMSSWPWCRPSQARRAWDLGS